MAANREVQIILKYEEEIHYFLVVRDDLIAESGWVNAVFRLRVEQDTGDETDEETETILFPDAVTDPEIFETFLQWLSSGCIAEVEEMQMDDFAEEIRGREEDEKDEVGEWEINWRRALRAAKRKTRLEWSFETLVKCFVLGEHLQAPSFTNEVIDQLIRLTKRLWKNDLEVIPTSKHFPILEYAWKNTTPDSQLRRVFLDNFNAVALNDVERYEIMQSVPKGMREEFEKETKDLRKRKKARAIVAWKMGKCAYHRPTTAEAGQGKANGVLM